MRQLKELQAEVFMLNLEIRKDEKVMFSYDKIIKDLKETIEGYKKAMVDLDKKTNERYELQLEQAKEEIFKDLFKEFTVNESLTLTKNGMDGEVILSEVVQKCIKLKEKWVKKNVNK